MVAMIASVIHLLRAWFLVAQVTVNNSINYGVSNKIYWHPIRQ